MTTLTSLARAEAVGAGVAAPIATVRHAHLHGRPLVVVPLIMAGEANAPLAVLVGDDRDTPRLLVVPNPRNRDMRFEFAAAFGEIVLAYIDSFASRTEETRKGKESRLRYADAPQVLLPNAGGIGFMRLFGRSTRFRKTEGEYAVKPVVPLLGRWLTFLGERAEYPGASMLLAATDLLAMHWATGQSATEDGNLAALLGWIAPPEGQTGAQAAADAEDPLRWPPAGPATDPTFDNEVLARLIETGNTQQMTRALEGQLRPTWELMWHAIDLLRRLPEGASVGRRWDDDKDAYTDYLTYMRDGGLPQPRRDNAVTAAQRLQRLENAQLKYAAQRALDDPLVFAEYRMTGEAFAGTVTAADATRTVPNPSGRRVLRPVIVVTTSDPVKLEQNTKVVAVGRPKQNATICEINPTDTGTEIRLELTNGMGRSLTPEPGSVPEVGDWLAYTSFTAEFRPGGEFPSREETPWTHGGPPAAHDYQPTEDDAREVWE